MSPISEVSCTPKTKWVQLHCGPVDGMKARDVIHLFSFVQFNCEKINIHPFTGLMPYTGLFAGIFLHESSV